MTDGRLFTKERLNDYLQARLKGAISAVDEVPPEELRFSAGAVVDRLIEEHHIALLELDFDAMTRTPVVEAKLTETLSRTATGYRASTRPGQRLSLIVPFTGNPLLLTCEPDTTHTGGPPHASLRDDAVIFTVEAERLSERYINDEINAMRHELTTWATWANQDVLRWTPKMRNRVSQAVHRRKELLDHAAELSDAIEIPLAPTSETTQVHVPIKRKRVRIEQAPASPGKDDPRLADDIYEDVIRTISGMSRAVERLPRTAIHLGEDGFRDLLLFMLNANYAGGARGEVFNVKGKTDILLSWKDRNAFIGECKVWHGPRKLGQAVTQLLGYAGWRDTKAALIVFIKGGSPTEIIDKADSAIRAHPCFRSATHGLEPDLRRDYLMTFPSDAYRYIRMALLPVIVQVPADDNAPAEMTFD